MVARQREGFGFSDMDLAPSLVQFDYDSCPGVEKSSLWLLGNDGDARIFLAGSCQNGCVLVRFGGNSVVILGS